TGQKAFEGETVSDVLAAVIMKEPDWSALPETVPISMQRLIRRSLQKDPHQRLQAIGDARIAIEEALAGDTVSNMSGQIAAGQPETGVKRPPLRRVLPWAVAITAIIAAGLGAVAARWVIWPQKAEPAIRFTVSLPENVELSAGRGMSISPNGRVVAFVARAGPGKPFQLWLRALDSPAAVPIQGTEGAVLPFWSPDSQQIGFGTKGKLQKVAVTGGPVQILCDDEGLGATWNRNGVILFMNQGKLYRVSDAGGTATLAAAPKSSSNYLFPQFLPDGRHFLFIEKPKELADTPGHVSGSLEVGSLDSKKTAVLLEASSEALYAEPGYLFYVQGGTLMARRFDARSLKFTAQPVLVAENVHPNGLIFAPFSVSQNGALVYQAGAADMQVQMAWFDRSGHKSGTVGQPGTYGDPVISPDGNRLAVVVAGSDNSTSDVWVYDLKRGTGSRLTFASAQNSNPLWSGDGSRIFFASNRNGESGIYEKSADGLGSSRVVFQSSNQEVNLDALSSDGHYALYMSHSPANSEWAVPLTGDRKPFPLFQGNFIAERSRFSPNGKYVAYISSETGSPEVYVQTFPQHLGKWRISSSGGDEPLWRGDGKELFYLSPDNEVMAVDVRADSREFQAGEPKPLFKSALANLAWWRNSYAVSHDGQRILILVPASEAKPEPIAVVMNWQALLKK
ncbi:MAG: hypothetical protein ACRD25_00945, partial [Terracidiphilus sp.]